MIRAWRRTEVGESRLSWLLKSQGHDWIKSRRPVCWLDTKNEHDKRIASRLIRTGQPACHAINAAPIQPTVIPTHPPAKANATASSQSHLSANFRRETGITPPKFRESVD